MKTVKDTIGIDIKEDFKQKVFELIDETIENVLLAENATLTAAEKRKIKNLSLDQLNVNITSKINSKTIWVFSAESTLPVTIERESGIPNGTSLIKKDESPVFFKMRPNGSWIMTKEKDEKCFTKEEFEEQVLKMILEDVETAAFYGTSSYIRK